MNCRAPSPASLPPAGGVSAGVLGFGRDRPLAWAGLESSRRPGCASRSPAGLHPPALWPLLCSSQRSLTRPQIEISIYEDRCSSGSSSSGSSSGSSGGGGGGAR